MSDSELVDLIFGLPRGLGSGFSGSDGAAGFEDNLSNKLEGAEEGGASGAGSLSSEADGGAVGFVGETGAGVIAGTGGMVFGKMSLPPLASDSAAA